MSLNKLPEIKAFDELSGLTFKPDETAVARWNPAIHSAVEGDKNVISIYDVIGVDSWTGEGIGAKRVAAALRSIGKDNEVTVNINSPGGDFFEGVAIYELLRQHPAKVSVKIMGLAASAASVIAMAGDEIEISDVGFIMIHNAWAVAIGNRHDMMEAANMLGPFDEAMAGLYAARSGADQGEMATLMDKETWLNGKQAIEIGLADTILAAGEMSESDHEKAKALLTERRAEMALCKGGLTGKESKTLIAQLKSGSRDAPAHFVNRDVDESTLNGLRDIIAAMH